MKHDCTCEQLARDRAANHHNNCLIHARCACGCARHDHETLIGQCGNDCHGCPEYRPAQLVGKQFTELRDDAIDAMPVENLRIAYRELRAHHIEETTVLWARHAPQRVQRRRDNPNYAHSMDGHESEAAYLAMLDGRHIDIDNVCKVCAGYGVRVYSSTATWHGGIGGASMTTSICDQCWGSGDRVHPWTDLRTLRDETEARIAERALVELARSCGANFESESTKAQVKIIIEHIDAIQRKRKIGNAGDRELFWVKPLANGLANTLRRAIGEEEKKF